ncbi:hypothetical protein JXB11_04655 [Candidatus Woesearchaeota archaeon]|nr:hypothetical protein [Candidatus Woesearchaeota archaeon]
MIDRKEFARMRKGLEKADSLYEAVFSQSRGIVRLSKKVIYSVHRGELGKAAGYVNKITQEVAKLRKNCPPEFLPQLKIAEQEFVEAVCFYNLLRNGTIPGVNTLKVMPTHYLLGLCDLSGEVARKAINAAIEGDDSTALKMRKFVELLYDEMMQFELRNGELRKKFDGIKYDLKRLEDVALHIKRK